MHVSASRCYSSQWTRMLIIAFLVAHIVGLAYSELACTVLPSSVPVRSCTRLRPSPEPTDHAQILWDTWGVPHIFGNDTEGLFYAFGWAQMRSHGNLILRLYGQARARAAEYWGPAYLGSDQLVTIIGSADRAPEWYTAQTPTFRRHLDAFAAGMNAYARLHPESLSYDTHMVLPVSATDVLAHVQRSLFGFLAATGGQNPAFRTTSFSGSNGWAIGPSRSASRNSLLLANPHLGWSGGTTWFEAQLTAPGINAYGVALVGMPVLGIAFNDYLGWTATVNPMDGCDVYELTLAKDGYQYNNHIRSFQIRNHRLKIRQDTGGVREQPLVVRRSIHGPVVDSGGKSFAIRTVAVDQCPTYGVLEQLWDMARAKNLNQFQNTLRRLQLPMFNLIYADRAGHIMLLFNGRVPVRNRGDWRYWQGIVPGNSSTTLWTTTHSYDALPKVIDPPSGWLQNSNSPPWVSTFPPALDPNRYPPYMAPHDMSLREQRGVRMLIQQRRISLDSMVQKKHSTRMELADRILSDLLALARQDQRELVRQSEQVLASWDRRADADSRGAVLFATWVQEMRADDRSLTGIFAVPWSSKAPRDTPKGLRDRKASTTALATAAAKVQASWGRLDVPWGHVFRLRRGKHDLPANGGPGELGIFRVIDFAAAKDRHYEAVAGDSYVAALEFSKPVRAKVLLTYGNSSQPGSPHLGDQLILTSRKQMRPVWRTRIDISAHLAMTEEV
jgi:acyl-homoserine-lactone acylase